MAIYVAIRKVASYAEFFEYSFGPTEENMGRLRINKFSGDIMIIEEVSGDLTQFNSIRAIRRLTLHFREKEFPDITCFAS